MLAGRRDIRRVQPWVGAIVAVVGLAACGGSSTSGAAGSAASSNPRTLLKQTFSTSHTVKSGVLQVSLVIDPTGSSTLSTPVSLTLGGPFQSRGPHQTPESSFTVTGSALGKKGSFGVISTATGAYTRLQGATYQLPRSDFKKLQSGIAGGSSTGSAPGLSTLGIDPSHWLTAPKIVGTETVDGARTEHLRSAVDVPAFISDLNTLLAKESKATSAASSAGVPTRISPATAGKIAAAVRSPTVDVWTGKSDSTLRRLTVAATIPVSGRASAELGGMTSAALKLSLNYAQLNQAQTIAAPAHARPYSELRTKLASLGAEIQGAFGTNLNGAGSTASGAAGSSAGKVSRYSRCITAAAGDVTKMQKCASLLNGGR